MAAAALSLRLEHAVFQDCTKLEPVKVKSNNDGHNDSLSYLNRHFPYFSKK